MKTLLLLSLMAILGLSLQAQDKIFRKDGAKINCKITAIDDSKIFFTYVVSNSKSVDTYILKENVEKYKKDKVTIVIKNEEVIPQTPTKIVPVEITPEEPVEEGEML